MAVLTAIVVDVREGGNRRGMQMVTDRVVVDRNRRASTGDDAKKSRRRDRKSIPMGRLATGEEIARVVAFISSPAASFVAGANWFVDGAEAVPTFAHSASEMRIRQRNADAGCALPATQRVFHDAQVPKQWLSQQ